MDYEDAKQIGDVGEGQVAEALEHLRHRYGFDVMHDVLIMKRTRHGGLTAQLDHVVIDQFGVLVIETKSRNGALIRGTLADKKWTAVYSAGSKKTFQNPLRQNDQQRVLLCQLLASVGVDVSLDNVQGLVVFVGVDQLKLEVDSASAARVVALEELPDAFGDRYGADSRGKHLDDIERAAIRSATSALDQSGDAEVQAIHAAYRQNRRGAGAAAPIHNESGALAYLDGLSRTGTTPRQPVSGRRVLLAVTLGLSMLGFGYWAVAGMIHRTAPAWVWVAAFFTLAVLSGEANSSGSRSRRGGRTNPKPQSSFGDRLISVALRLAFVAVVAMLGVWGFRAVTKGLPTRIAPSTTERVQEAQSGPTVEMAKRALKGADAKMYARLANPDTPIVGTKNGYASFTWQYLEKTAANATQVRTIEAMVDNNGQIVGFNKK